MTKASVFLNNKTQAVRLPKDVALPSDVKSVDVTILGNGRLITPTGQLWDNFFDDPPASDDYMDDRAQPNMQKRDQL